MSRRCVAVLIGMVASAAMVAPVSAEAPRGSLGFSIEVDGEGFFLNPTLKTVTVTSVTPASPAASAGITARDQIVEADGHRVAGAKARDLEPLLKKAVGETLILKLKRPTGEEYLAVLVAASRRAPP